MEHLSRAVAVPAIICHTGGFNIKITNTSYAHCLYFGNILLCQSLGTTTAFQSIFSCPKITSVPSLYAFNFLTTKRDFKKTTIIQLLVGFLYCNDPFTKIFEVPCQSKGRDEILGKSSGLE